MLFVYKLYINTLYSNSNVVGVFIVNCRIVVSLTGSHPPPSLAAHEVVHPGALYNMVSEVCYTT